MLPHYIAYNLFFAQILHKFVYIEDAPYILFPILIPVLIFLIGKTFLKGRLSFIPVVIFLLSPWFWYLSIAHSFYIFLFFLTLTVIYGIILIRSDNLVMGSILTVLPAAMAAYSSSLFLIFLPASFTVLVAAKIIKIKSFKLSVIFFVVLTLPLIFLSAKNKTDFRGSLSQEVKIFSDPGLLNTVNRYQGAAEKAGLKTLSRISENKYLFYSEYFLLKYTTQLTPVTLFTPQYKLLGFSFEPPILLGLLFPFIFGLYRLLLKPDARKIIFCSTLLTIPSILSNEPAALNRLILFSPVAIIIISFGLIYLYKLKAGGIAKTFFILTIVLFLFQFVIAFSDIKSREGIRFHQYFGQKYQLVEP